MRYLTDQVDGLFEQWDRPDSPGCAVGVIKDGDLVYKRGYGTADLDSKAPLTPSSVFDVCSIGKQFTAACIALLVQRGDISLDDDIRTYVPEVPRYDSPITIRHLVHHTSGLRDYIDLARLAGSEFKTYFGQKEALEIIVSQPALNFEPGSEHLYCNSGYVSLAGVVERVTGGPFAQFAKEQVFDPLGMRNTRYYDGTASQAKGRVTGYQAGESGRFTRDTTTFFTVGDGGLLTTVDDLCLWDRAFSENKQWDEATTRLMLTSGKLNNGGDTNYGFGLVLGEYKGLRTVHHAGEWVGYQTDMVRFPDQHFTAICLSNLETVRPTRLTRRMADIYLADHFDLTEFVGEYRNDELRATHELVLEGTQVFLRQNGRNREPLGAMRSDRFKFMDADARFDRDEHGTITGFTCSTERARNIRFVKMGAG